MKRALRLRSAGAVLALIASAPLYAGEVLPNGSYSHTVEIQLPPGTNSMQPKLALQYNSNGSNGMVGVGWSLQGLPAITRWAKFDGGINYDVSDYLSGDGQDGYYFMGEPLVRVSDLDASAIYHTRNENFSRYEPIGLCGDGPCSWRVTDSSGLVYLYGDSADSKVTADLPLNAPNSVRLWALTKIIDLNGNFYEVGYRQDSGEIYPAKIIYTQNISGGISRYRVVEFEYEEGSRTDYTVSYATLSLVQTKWRLRDIVIKTNVITFLGITVPFTGDLVRRYHLGYEQSLYLRRSLLVSLQEFGSDDTAALPPHRFEWSNAAPALAQTFTTSAANSSWSSNYGNTIVADFNGDGIADVYLNEKYAYGVTRNLTVFTSQTLYTDKLRRLVSPQGMELTLDYTPASQMAGAIQPLTPHCYTQSGFYLCDPVKPYGSPALSQPNPLRRALVSKMTVGDGRGGAYATTFEYNNARIVNGNFATRRDAGFEWVKKTDLATGQSEQTFYRQNTPELAGKPAEVRGFDALNRLMRISSFDYLIQTPYIGVAFVGIANQTSSFYERDVFIASKSQSFTYDQYGNKTQTVDASDGTQTVITDQVYKYDLANGILNHVIDKKITANSQVVSWEKSIRDGSCGQFRVCHKQIWLDKDVNGPQNRFISVKFTYDAYGNVLTSTDPLNRTTSYAYDVDYRTFVEEITTHLGHKIQNKYDPGTGQKTKEVDIGNGDTYIVRYDVFGRFVQEDDPAGNWVKRNIYNDNSLGNPNLQFTEEQIRTDSTGNFQFNRKHFDGLGRVYKTEKTGFLDTAISQQLILTVDTVFDAPARVLRESAAYLAPRDTPVFTTYTYDEASRVKKITFPDGSFGLTTYAGLTTATTDTMGNSRTVVKDSRGRTLTVFEPEGSTINSVYDASGRIVQITDADGKISSIYYDSLGRKIMLVDSGTGIWKHEYDDLGNHTKKIDPKGQQVTFTYDAINRPTLIDYGGTQPNVTYEYDSPLVNNGIGRLTKITDASGSTEYSYDDKGNVVSWIQSIGSVALGIPSKSFHFTADFDIQNRMYRLNYPDGETSKGHL
ncbi:MAG: hypothetical protein JSR44_11630 [Spirochaetes bacterium]|nr:hypothetical protein [Spirochaetota bacterium]